MKIAIVQHDIPSSNFLNNMDRLDPLLKQQPGADMYVLPETFATGFMAEGYVGGVGAQSHFMLQWMAYQAMLHNAAIVGSVAKKDTEGLLRNRLIFMHPDGKYDYYDKRHLFTFAGETKDYVPGDRRVIAEWGGVRFLLQVCYDLRFPVFSRSRGDYDAIIYVANWPAQRQDAWQTLLKARAIENQCYVIGVNRVGSDAACKYIGGSVVIDAYGRTIAQCTDGEEGIATVELDMEQLQRFRQKFPVLDDADKFNVL
ncbi:MAG: amidohydrolase [Prevotella sp.]|nr:amidohydrolase [Prevotella sp.]